MEKTKQGQVGMGQRSLAQETWRRFKRNRVILVKRLAFGFKVEYICYLQCLYLCKCVFIVQYDVLFQRQFILLQKPPQKLSLEHRQRPLHILPPRRFIHK